MLTAEDLRPIPVFASIPSEALHDIARAAADMRLMDGEYAYNEGDEAGFFVVISGRLAVIKIIDGYERKLGERTAGKVLGEVPLTFATRFPSAGRAMEQSRVLHLTARAFHDLAKAQPFVGRGVYYGTARTDARIAQGADVHLIGTGNSAGQAAMFMANHARCVSLVVRGDSLEKSMSQDLIDQIRSKSNIRVLLNTQVSAVRGDTSLSEVDLQDKTAGTTRTETSGGVFVFIGADAETDWLPDAIERDPRGYILTGTSLPKGTGRYAERDPYLLETSVPGVFACGDVRFGPVKRVAAAVGEGSMAIASVHQYLSTLPTGAAHP